MWHSGIINRAAVRSVHNWAVRVPKMFQGDMEVELNAEDDEKEGRSRATTAV
jgi:hypothetical protein